MTTETAPLEPFQTVNAEAGGVRCVTWIGGEVASSILIDPNRAEALAGQYVTEAARARSRKGALDAYGSWSRERQCLESTEQ